MYRADLLMHILHQSKYKSSAQFSGRWSFKMKNNERFLELFNELLTCSTEGEVEFVARISMVPTEGDKLYFICDDIFFEHCTVRTTSHIIIELDWIKSMERVDLDEVEVEVDMEDDY